MHLQLPKGPGVQMPIGSSQSTGLIFFSDPAPNDVALPFGASVSIHIWVNGTKAKTTDAKPCNVTLGDLKFRIDIYDPANNTVRQIPGAGETGVFALKEGVNYYEASWGHFAQGKSISRGETLMVTIWCPDCKYPPLLLFNGPGHPSNIDFPIEVPENSISLAAVAIIVPGLAGLVVDRQEMKSGGSSSEGGRGLRRVQGSLIIAAALIFLTLPLVLTFNDFLASIASSTGFDRVVGAMVPYEANAVADLLKGFGLPAGSSGSLVWLGAGFIPVASVIDWNCAGWQGFVLLGLTLATGLGEVRNNGRRIIVLLAGIAGIFAVNILRILIVVLLGYYVSYPVALIFHNYGGAVMTLAWLLGFWTLVLRHENDRIEVDSNRVAGI